MNILVTGGAGYIGSHCVRNLLDYGHNVVIVDDLSTGDKRLLDSRATFYMMVIDSHSTSELSEIMIKHRIDSVMHLSAYAYVGESVYDPLKYYSNNIESTVAVLSSMVSAEVKSIVYSSSCAVYGGCETVITEDTDKSPINPYGRTKLIGEGIMHDCFKAYGIRSVGLRYFNAGGASPDKGLGSRHDPELRVIPLLVRSAMTGSEFILYGNNYPTKDGSCIRDYVHVEDIAEAHRRSMELLVDNTICTMVNLSSNTCSVLDLAHIVGEVVGKKPVIKIGKRREGDPDSLVSCNRYAMDLLGWSPKKSIRDIVEDTYTWEKKLKKES